MKLAIARRPLGRSAQLRLSFLWFAMFGQWLTVLPVILPDQVTVLVGEHSGNKEAMIGTIAAAGAIVALITAPIAGALSDRTASQRGRRRPFLIAGCIGSSISLLLLIPFDGGGSIALYIIAILNLQLWWNIVSGAYAGLVPDVVPLDQQPAASGWLNVMTIGGTIFGNIAISVTYKTGHSALALTALSAFTVVALLVTLSVPESRSRGAIEPFRIGPFARSFFIEPKTHLNFYWVLITRFLSNMGVWSVLTFLLSYLQEVIHVEHPEQVLPMLLGAGALFAIPASLLGASLSNRYGIVRIVKVTSWIMATTVIGYVIAALHPSLLFVAPLVIVFSAAYGAYQAVDWALALRVLPSLDNAGKDMGVWHVSMVLPQILGPVATGWIISGIKESISAVAGYTTAFAIAATWFLLAALFLGKIRLGESATSG